MNQLVCFLLVAIVLITNGCTPHEDTKEENSSSTVNIIDALGGDNTEGFKRAEEVIEFQFPRDHGPHNEYRNEWWYITGNLDDTQGRRYGYQVTFFRIGLIPPDKSIQQNSNWVSRDIWMAHVALTDEHHNKHSAHERFSRGQPGMAGAQLNPFTVWLDDWQLIATDNDFPWHLSIATDNFSLNLQLEATKPKVLQGNQGLSQKSPTPGNASYYYSYPRLKTYGQIQQGHIQKKHSQQTIEVSGFSWLDREWSTSALDKDQTGWDWFSLQFDDGSELMYYQLRDLQGRAHQSSQGKIINSQSQTSMITPANIQLKPKRNWSDGESSYPVEWQISYQDHDLTIRPLIDNQIMNTTVKYWEGAVEIIDNTTKASVGRGYLEMTGY